MKIKYFKIGNFKSFTTTNNKVGDASDINFIYGDNNTGKSNILKFLNLIFSSKFERETISVAADSQTRDVEGNFYEGIISNEPYIYHKNKRGIKITFEFLINISKAELVDSQYEFYENLEKEYFNNANTDLNIKFIGQIYSLDNQATSYIELISTSIDGNEAYNFDGKDRIYFRGKKTLNDNGRAFSKLMSYFNNCVNYIDNNRYFGNEEFVVSNEGLSPENYKNWLYNYSLNPYSFDEYQNLLSFIRSFKIGKLIDIENLDLSFSLDSYNNLELMLNKGADRLPITSFGTGINQILYILTKIYISKSKILVIEELELNLSPKTQKEIFRICRELIAQNVITQVFFTSHSSFFNFRNDFSIYEVSIDNAKVSSITKKAGISGAFWLRRITD